MSRRIRRQTRILIRNFGVPVMCAAILLFAANPVWAEEDASGTPACAESLQAKIDAAPPGGVVYLANDCIYRESVTVDKPLILHGAGVGEIRGSEVWRAWNKDGSFWVSSATVPGLFTPSRYRCEDAGNRCRWPEQVFVDGEPLEQVASTPRPGQFALDAGRRVVLADDPAGRAVEVTVRERWVLGAASNVVVRGITMKHAALDGLWNGGYPGWRVADNDLSYAHAKNLALTLGSSLLAKNNDLHHAGQMGMSSNEAGVEILDNRIYNNNIESFDPGWEAGGMKITQPLSARISGNEVHNNKYIGIWTDVVNPAQNSVEISGNKVHHHPRQGIRVEITKNFEVRDNLVWENGWAQGDSYNGSGIAVAGSHDGTVSDNTLAWNASGIAVIQQFRKKAKEKNYQTTRNVRLEDNVVVQDEIPGTTDHAAVLWNEDGRAVAEGALSLYDPVANNGGIRNEYWFDEPEGRTYRFKWEDKFKNLADYNDTLAEKRGRYLSTEEKKSLLRSNSLPPSPENHPSTKNVDLTTRILQELKRWSEKLLGQRDVLRPAV